MRSRGALAALALLAVAAPALVTPTAAHADSGTVATATSAQHQPGKHHLDRDKHRDKHRDKGRQLARKLVQRTSAGRAMRHLYAWQEMADEHGGHRAAGSPGHDASAEYAGRLLRAAGYDVTYQYFDFEYRETLAETLRQLTPEQRDIGIIAMSYTASTPEGGIEGALAAAPVDEDGSNGCEPEDFADGGFTGRIALIKRGGCTFALKQQNAAAAGAVAAIVYNNTEGPLNGTLGSPDETVLPTGGITLEAGEALAAGLAEGEVTVALELREFRETRTTPNVIAETPGGDPENVVMVGAHLDSVPEGPGINDNGSGSGGVLETALQLARADRHGKAPNKVRFALWSAEEFGLLGAEHYVSELTEEERGNIALYLNFDMIASPNYGIFVYDGDGSEGLSEPGPDGSAQIEHLINTFLDGKGKEPRPTAFSGRSDYGPFIDVGIPSGGTFTGAEGLKTEAQAELWGGEAGVAYDACYHAECDDIDNLDLTAFETNIDVIAHLVGMYAWSTGSLAEEVPAAGPADPETAEQGGLHDDHGHAEAA
ncbi:M28 family metallopeptidase [Streptomyces aidingensis]|uniref:Zn-dependent amino-or carboxypeptidase, M28 family n=1 Tax=Streptomyces aidingensis TaxID=910347 RepID=A0A1I1QKE9_9ACTN|nr:M28 family metallopeptidase [Streptomyces aidingensis]SFD20308.1 Zn-dependent amino-or carboxypeptidase, M28 family [Streptomyces aidingensis]